MKPLLDLLKAGGGVVTAPDAVQNKAVSFDISRGRWVGLGRQDSFSVWDLYSYSTPRYISTLLLLELGV